MNPHDVELEKYLELELMELAAIEAQRSIAYEQRTASLVAWFASGNVPESHIEIVKAEIWERMDFI